MYARWIYRLDTFKGMLDSCLERYIGLGYG